MIWRRIVHWLGVRTMLSLMLLMGLFGSVVMALVDTSPGIQGAPLVATAAAAIGAGWLLARSPLPGWLAAGLALIVGCEGAMLGAGRLGRTLLGLIGSLLALPRIAWRWPWDRASGLEAIAQKAADLGHAATRLLDRLWNWLYALFNREPTFDPLAVACLWTLVIWSLAFWAAWRVRRQRAPLHAMAPAGALLGAILSYNRDQIAPLVLLLFFALPLLALVNYGIHSDRWKRDRVDHPEDVGMELASVVMGLTIILVFLALGAPDFSVRQITQQVRQLLQTPGEGTDRVAESLGISSRGTGLPAFETRSGIGLPLQHLIGTGPELEQAVVMLIETSPDLAKLGRQPYWRGITFDSYTGAGWTNGDVEMASYQAGELAGNPPRFPHQILRQKVQTIADLGGRLHFAGTLVSANHDFQIAWRTALEPALSGERDLVAATIGESRYQAESWLPNPTTAQLQSAGQAYPAWIEERYLTLPAALPTRVLTLSEQVSGDAANPYDQAVAIESFLRSMTYTLDLPPPPSDQDLVDYFLFDLQEGYCDYFASAMVVMARASGLPARLVVGYASGIVDEARDRTVITEADAHSWAEVYFPGYGWIEFEPTASRPVIDRTAVAGQIPKAWQVTEAGRGFSGNLSVLGHLWWIGIALPNTIVAAGWVWDGWRLQRLSPAETCTTLYKRLVRHGRRLGLGSVPGETPHEFASLLSDQVARVAVGRRWGDKASPILPHARWLIDLYVWTVYSAHTPDSLIQVQAIQAWRQLVWRLWLVRLGRWRQRRPNLAGRPGDWQI